MRILFIGDVVGRPGREMLRTRLPVLRSQREIDVIIANGENAVGSGITPSTAEDIFAAGVDVITLGNHAWDKKEINDYLEDNPRIIRPLNYPAHHETPPGRGWTVFESPRGPVVVINILGRVFLPIFPSCPFQAADEALAAAQEYSAVTIIDFHAEATSEKQAMGWYVDGRATAVLGTHTHVQTADSRVLPGGTAYISDAGMTGPINSVIGVKVGPAVRRFLTQRPVSYETADGPQILSGVLLDVDPATGKALAIERIYEHGS